MRKIILITGGQRSGKSSYGEKLALELAATVSSQGDPGDDAPDVAAKGVSAKPIYLATARIWDEEFAQRVARHQQGRDERWENREEETELSRHNVQGRVVLVDCVTLWATNFFFDTVTDEGIAVASGSGTSAPMGKETVERTLAQLKAEFDKFTAQEAVFIFVTNEIGMGEVSQNVVQRRFTDLQGWLNQYIAARADRVVLMVSGIPVPVKGNP